MARFWWRRCRKITVLRQDSFPKAFYSFPSHLAVNHVILASQIIRSQNQFSFQNPFIRSCQFEIHSTSAVLKGEAALCPSVGLSECMIPLQYFFYENITYNDYENCFIFRKLLRKLLHSSKLLHFSQCSLIFFSLLWVWKLF